MEEGTGGIYKKQGETCELVVYEKRGGGVLVVYEKCGGDVRSI